MSPLYQFKVTLDYDRTDARKPWLLVVRGPEGSEETHRYPTEKRRTKALERLSKIGRFR